MTTSHKLWLGFGTLTALLVLSGVAILVRVRSIEGAVQEQANVALPRSAVTRELETNVLDFALAVRTYLHQAEPQARLEAVEAVTDVERYLAEYEGYAETERQWQFAVRFTALWKELKDHG